MTEEALIEAAEFGIQDSFVNGMSMIDTFGWCVIGGLYVVVLAFLIVAFEWRNRREIWSTVGVMFLVSGILTGLLYQKGHTSITHGATIPYHGIKYEEFVNEKMYPYIDKMEERRVEIQAAKRLDEKVGGRRWPTSDEPLVPMSIVYADENNKARILKVDALILYDEKDEKPYMTYKEFTQDIAFDFKKGPFNVTLHLPKGYYFNQ